MTFGEGTYKKPQAKEEKKNDLKIGFIETNSTKGRPTKPVVIPSAVNKDNVKKLTRKQIGQEPISSQINETEYMPQEPEQDAFSNILDEENEPKQETVTKVEPVKKGRGRPKKQVETPVLEEQEVKPKRRGRPKKQVVEPEEVKEEPEEDTSENTLPGFDEIEENTLPGFDEIEENTLPGFEEEDTNSDMNLFNLGGQNSFNQNRQRPEENYVQNVNIPRESANLTRLLSKDKKVVAFVGTSKCGTSFLINNLADLLSKSGINTAILDVTNNRNSYYIYTRNEEALRRKALNCLESLEQNIVDGIEVSKNLTVFTSVPNRRVEVRNIEAVISTLVRNYSLVLVDCDFQTPTDYFELAQEIYLVQSMDILTIQPLTAFLRDLQSNNILNPEKLKVVINKAMKVRGLNASAIIGGMSCYNDPEMSYMRNLFDKDKIPAITISFDGDVLAKYLSGMVDCMVTTNGYSKQFMSELKKLADMVYPLINNKYKPDYTKNNKFANRNNSQEGEPSSFTSNINSTLDRMKRQFK